MEEGRPADSVRKIKNASPEQKAPEKRGHESSWKSYRRSVQENGGLDLPSVYSSEGDERVKRMAQLMRARSGKLVIGKKLDLQRTSDPDYYAETLLYEIRQTHQSVMDCFEDLKKHLTVIEKLLMTMKGGVKKK
jgi:hypothetical protein